MTEQFRASNEPTPLHAEPQSVMGLVKQAADDASDLVTKEVALAKSEISHSIEEAKAGAISMITGGSVLYAGFVVLLFAGVIGLAEVLELWLSALIVGGAVALIGLIMVMTGKKKVEPGSFKPERTTNQLRKDRDAIKGATV